MVGFVHFSNFLIPSEKYYKLQSCWITLYFLLHLDYRKLCQNIILCSVELIFKICYPTQTSLVVQSRLPKPVGISGFSGNRFKSGGVCQ